MNLLKKRIIRLGWYGEVVEEGRYLHSTGE